MKKEKKKRGLAARLLLIVVYIIIIVMIAVLGANLFVIKKTENKIAAEISSADDSIIAQEVSDLKAIKPECIMVLGASVHADGTPSLMLKDRLDVGIEPYKYYILSVIKPRRGGNLPPASQKRPFRFMQFHQKQCEPCNTIVGVF